LVDGCQVDFIGEITEVEKTRFPGDAVALLFPIDWPEPFGLTMIETMTGGCVARAARLSRKRCGEQFEQRFQPARKSQTHVYELATQQTCAVIS
jgi:glycosyltransferase involved in cell wall biosynthesis